MGRLQPEIAYPGVTFQARTRNWWARLVRVPAECVHLEFRTDWMVSLVPDVVYLRGKAQLRREPHRPEVSLCRECFVMVMQPELEAFTGRVVAFEPDGEACSQYFFLAREDFAAAGLKEEVSTAIEQRLTEAVSECEVCPRPACWLWISRSEVVSLDEAALIASAPGRKLCAAHGAAALCEGLTRLPEANLFYVNVPYGAAGAYVWI
jgi:hypothetical protein